MSNTNDQPIAVLNGLIETTLDSACGYREAAGRRQEPGLQEPVRGPLAAAQAGDV